MLSNFGFTGRNSTSWIDAYGENFGRDDTYFSARGGMYDVFKARAYTNWMPHNFLFNGITPFAGSGTSNQTATFQKPNLGTWTNVDIGYERKDTGGYFEWQRQSPWYFRVDGNQVKTQGSKVGGSSNTTSPGGGYVDLALPVEYETNNVAFEAGYTTRTMTFTASFLNSNFSNNNPYVNWNNPSFGSNVDRTYLPPDNQYQRLALNGVGSRPAVELDAGGAIHLGQDDERFCGQQHGPERRGFGRLHQPPARPRELRRRRGPADVHAGLGGDAGDEPRHEVLLQLAEDEERQHRRDLLPERRVELRRHVRERPVGLQEAERRVDAWYRINRNNRIGGGYDYNHITQNRLDFDDTSTNTFWLEYKYSGTEGLGVRLKYSYLDRNSDYLESHAGANANDPLYLTRYTRAFDLADMKQDRVKLTIDWSPADNMGIALEGIYKDNDYDDTTLGRTGDKRWELFANLTYGTPSSWRLNLFGDYEKVKYDEYHRYISNPSCTSGTPPPGPNCHDPATPPTVNAYNWASTVKNDNWLIGLGVDYPVNEALMVTGSVLYEKTDGSADFASQNNYGNPLPLTVYPNVKTTSLNLKGVYRFNKNWSVTGGYAYQKYDYSDDQFNGYTNTIPFPGLTTGSSQSYLNGWNAYTPYNANIFYLLATFKFDPPPQVPATMMAAAAPPAPVARPAPPPPPPAPAPAPAPAPQVQKITLDSKVLFDFDKAVLKPEGMAAIDSQVVGKLAQVQKLEVVLVTGHTDRLGSDAYNQKLSERRADAVRNYLVSKGVAKDKIETIGMGEKQPVVQCDQKDLKALIACLQPNRRVEVEVKGETRK